MTNGHKHFGRNSAAACAVIAGTALLQCALSDTAWSLSVERSLAPPLPTHRVAQQDEPTGDVGAPVGEEPPQSTLATEPLESCMARWDEGTHMTKKAWRETCKRIARERLPYVKGPRVSPDVQGSAR